MVESNRILYDKGEKPDHCVVIKYVPYVGDSKRALDEYTSEIFMHGLNTIVLHNTCEVYSCHQCLHSNVHPLFYAPLTQNTPCVEVWTIIVKMMKEISFKGPRIEGVVSYTVMLL